jgi:hypothetical protein
MLKTLEDRSVLRFALAVGAIWAVFGLAYIFGPGDAQTWIANIGTLLGAWGIFALAFLLRRFFEQGEIAHRIWSLLLVGFLLWAVGDSLWAYYDLLPGGEVPYPSLADLSWVAAYPVIFIGLWHRYRSMESVPSRTQSRLLVAAVLLGIAVFAFVLWPILTYPDYDRRLEQVLDVLYPLGDFALVVASLLVAVSVHGGRLAAPWRLITLGTAVLGLSDLLFVFATWHDLYVIEPPLTLVTIVIDLSYIAAYGFILIGEFVQGRLDRTF